MGSFNTSFYLLVIVIAFGNGHKSKDDNIRKKRTQAYRFYDFLSSDSLSILNTAAAPDDDVVNFGSIKRDCSVSPEMELIDRPTEAFFHFETLGDEWYPGNLGLKLEQTGPELYDFTGQKRTEIRWKDVSVEVHPTSGCQVLKVQLYTYPLPTHGFCILTVKDNALTVLPEQCYHSDAGDIPPDEENTVWLHGVKYYPDEVEFGEAIYSLCANAECNERVEKVVGIDDLRLVAVRLHMYEKS